MKGVRTGAGIEDCWQVCVCGARGGGEERALLEMKARHGPGSGLWAKEARREGSCHS